MTFKSNHHIFAVKHLRLVQLFVHSIKLLLCSKQFCNAVLRAWYLFAFRIILDLRYVNRIEIEYRGSLHCIFWSHSWHLEMQRYWVLLNLLVTCKCSQSPGARASEFCALENLCVRWKMCWSIRISLGVNLEKTVWCSCSYRYSCREHAGWVVSKQLATWW